MENRRAPRIVFSEPVVVLAAQRVLRCQAVDLSTTGMLVLPPAQAGADLPLSLDFAFPGRGERLQLTGRIAREGRHNGVYAWGIYFVDVPPAVSTALLRAVHRQSFKNVIASALDEAIAVSHGVLAPAGAEPLTSIDSGVLGVRARPIRTTRSAVAVLQQCAACRGRRNPERAAQSLRATPPSPQAMPGGLRQQRPKAPRDLARLYRQALAEVSGDSADGRRRR